MQTLRQQRLRELCAAKQQTPEKAKASRHGTKKRTHDRLSSSYTHKNQVTDRDWNGHVEHRTAFLGYAHSTKISG